MEEVQILKDLVVILVCAVPVVYLFHRLKQSPVIGFMISGILIGPFALSLIDDVETVNTLATVGVMILLFSLGLEFSLKKLLETRVAVFASGPLQMAGTTAAVAVVAHFLGATLQAGLLYGTLIGVSSTAVFMRVLSDRGETDSVHGRIGLGVCIFQDLCTIPVMVLIPLLATGERAMFPVIIAVAKALAIIVAMYVVARYLFPVLLTAILRAHSKELFLITSVLMFLGTAWATSLAGISLALGSFLAGLILSESEYGQQIFADVRPFRDSLNCLFFIAMGMLVNPVFIGANVLAILGMTAAIVIGKSLIATGAVWATRFPAHVAIVSGISLAQIGEFSFILLQAAASAGLVSTGAYQMILASSLVTMVLAPANFNLVRWLVGRRDWRAPSAGGSGGSVEIAKDQLHDHVIICGFGEAGRNIARALKANGIRYIVLELSAQRVREGARYGEPIMFGDCASAHILELAGIARARVIVFVISDPYAARMAIRNARNANREIVILTRTKRITDMDELWDQGSTEVIAEEFEASLELMTRVLRAYNAPRALVAAEIKSIRTERFGIFRSRPATVPRIRLSSELDIYTETWEVPEGSTWHGRSVAETRLRSATGVLILGIIRSGRTINNPPADEKICSRDRLVLSGTKEQLGKAIEMLTHGPSN